MSSKNSEKKCAVCDKTGPFKSCAGCNEVAYCCKECQKQHWKVHKTQCKKKHKKKAAAGGNKHLAPVSKSTGPEVTWEDQRNINTFGRLNQRHEDLKDEIKAIEKRVLDLQDGASEVEMVLDDDACKFRVGECFFDVTNEEAEEFVEEEEKDDAEDVETLREEQNTVKAEMEKLKSVLYGRFGNSINLETGSDD